MNQKKNAWELPGQMQEYIREQELMGPGTPVLVGVSGGADSMCLLVLLLEYRRVVDFPLQVIHVEHGIRGEDSRQDAEYVEYFCARQGVGCRLEHVDAGRLAEERGLSLEEAGRELRYAAFSRAADSWQEQLGAQVPEVRIAVAHHREDQAETMLWQMIRGSDIRGLGGMRPRRGRIIRPLLFAGREQIEDYLDARGIAWREDVTNRQEVYTRNRLRHSVLPVLGELNSQAVSHLWETAQRLQETEDYLALETRKKLDAYTRSGPEGIFITDSLLAEHPLMIRRAVYACVEQLSRGAKDVGAKHIALIRDLFSHRVGACIQLPGGLSAERCYDGVLLFSGKKEGQYLQENTFSPEQFAMEVLQKPKMSEISKKKYTKWFDYDKIKNNMQIRGRREGDYLVIDAAGHRQSLQRYLRNEKVPAALRDGLPLLADGSHIMWVVGYRISDYYKVDEYTKRVLKVQLIGGKEDE